MSSVSRRHITRIGERTTQAVELFIDARPSTGDVVYGQPWILDEWEDWEQPPERGGAQPT